MTTYTLPAFVIAADNNAIPVDAFTTQMEFVAPTNAPAFSYDLVRVEDFDGLGDVNVASLNQTVFAKSVDGGTIDVPETNYHAIFGVNWGGNNRSIVMIASANPTTRVGIVIDGDPFPQIDSLAEYYAWVDTFDSVAPVSSGPYAPGQTIRFDSFPDVALTESTLTRGTPGPDVLNGDQGDNDFDGLGGIDTAFFDGPMSGYTLSISATGLVVEDRRPEGQGRDTLRNVEFIDFGTEIAAFNGDPVDIGRFDGAVDLQETQFLEIIELYIAYFNRAPDAIGLLFWANAVADGLSLTDMAAFFNDQPETRAAYPDSMSNAEVVNTVYVNVLNRAPEQGGFDFWFDVLERGAVGRDQFILEIIAGAKADPDPSTDQATIDLQLADRATLASKIDIGTYFAVTRGMSDVENAATVMGLFERGGSAQAAVDATDQFFTSAQSATDGEFLMPLIGVLDSPF